MDTLVKIVDTVNSILWDNILIYALLGVGILYTVILRVPQISKIGPGFKQTFGGLFSKEKEEKVEGEMTSFQALATAVAAQVGTGNLAGVATAIAAGGPGAVFWMWMSAIFGMATNFGEAVLAQKYSETIDGEKTGGPAYYLAKGVNSKFLAGFFAVSIILALGFVGNMVQSNSIADAVSSALTNYGVEFSGLNIAGLQITGIQLMSGIIGILTAIIVGLILVGGMKRIASFAELVVPIMAGLYVIGGIVILIKFRAQVPAAFGSIFTGAFNKQALLGGALGVTVKQAVRLGVARGLFSNEAGMGSTPHAHAVANVAHPAQQGMTAMVGVIIDTGIVCTVTALINIVTGANAKLVDTVVNGEVVKAGITGIAMTQEAFGIGLGSFGLSFIAVSLFFFALTTIVGWYFFGESNIKYLFGAKAVPAYRWIVLGFVVLGSFLKVEFVWELADMFNGLMVIPNVIGLVILAPQASRILKDYNNNFLD